MTVVRDGDGAGTLPTAEVRTEVVAIVRCDGPDWSVTVPGIEFSASGLGSAEEAEAAALAALVVATDLPADLAVRVVRAPRRDGERLPADD